MGFLFKTLLVLIVVAVVGGFVVNRVPALKQNIIETINPAAKEGRLLGEMTANLNQLGNSLNDLAGTKNSSDQAAKIKKSQDLLAASRNLLSSVATINQSNSGLIKQGLTKIIDAFIDKTPYPADHLTPASSTSLSPAVICPTPSK